VALGLRLIDLEFTGQSGRLMASRLSLKALSRTGRFA
jgi:hypothetical protein